MKVDIFIHEPVKNGGAFLFEIINLLCVTGHVHRHKVTNQRNPYFIRVFLFLVGNFVSLFRDTKLPT
ncbi:hypothetical protein KAI36_02581 [Paenibacillus sp. S02]|nr:hypothetical protein KAI36_02581 [Paenibacillus sp. S02]